MWNACVEGALSKVPSYAQLDQDLQSCAHSALLKTLESTAANYWWYVINQFCGWLGVFREAAGLLAGRKSRTLAARSCSNINALAVVWAFL